MTSISRQSRSSVWRAAALFALILVSAASAETVPAWGAVDSRIRTAGYRSDEVYRLYGFVGYELELIFEEGENFVGQGGGDLEGIAFAAHTHHLVIKPTALNVGTNLVVYTDRRAYRIDYSASVGKPDPRKDEVMYAVQFVYPPSPKGGGRSAAEQADVELARAGTIRPRNYDYWYCGSPAVRPVAASDDGVHTRLTFAARSELPALFVRNDDGSESLLNFSMDGGDVIVHRVAAQFVIRRGKLTGCVVNKGFAGAGEWLESGTVAPDVKRERKGRHE